MWTKSVGIPRLLGIWMTLHDSAMELQYAKLQPLLELPYLNDFKLKKKTKFEYSTSWRTCLKFRIYKRYRVQTPSNSLLLTDRKTGCHDFSKNRWRLRNVDFSLFFEPDNFTWRSRAEQACCALNLILSLQEPIWMSVGFCNGLTILDYRLPVWSKLSCVMLTTRSTETGHASCCRHIGRMLFFTLSTYLIHELIS